MTVINAGAPSVVDIGRKVYGIPAASFIPREARSFATHLSIGMTESSTLDGEVEVEIVYVVKPGTPERGLYGPPEHYDPGSPAELTVYALRTMRDSGRIDLTWMGTTWIEEDEEMRDALIAAWFSEEQSAADDAADQRAQMRREDDDGVS